MLSMSVDDVNYIGQFEKLENIFDIIKQHNISSIYVGEFNNIPEDCIRTGHNFYTFLEMDHKVRVILRNCVWNRIPGVGASFQEELVKEFDKLANNWLLTYGYVGRKEQAFNVKQYFFNQEICKFEEVKSG
jgi:hypothetical protein